MIVLAILRLLIFALMTGLYIGIVLCSVLFVKERAKVALKFRRPYFLIVFRVLGLRPILTGRPSKRTALYIGNHITYLDPFVLAYFVDIWPVAKQELASWPIIGYATKLAGVIFVKRESGKSRKNTRDAVVKGLKDERSILVYPEGTSSAGISTLPFKPGSFNLAVDNSVPVVPVCITYNNPKAPFIGDDTFLPHFLKFFSRWRNDVYLHIGDEIMNGTPKEIIDETQAQINEQLAKFREMINENH